ncbi:hypothetical protein [Caudoviricetes sp.]|nr:hypothetical protein [Caudoviricetes sp.]
MLTFKLRRVKTTKNFNKYEEIRESGRQPITVGFIYIDKDQAPKGDVVQIDIRTAE